ncbi:MAG: TrmB family transcriptional regulator [Candidatus Poseidoniales archaeon]|jgi:sugar-specific transcriptional regulator TrmB/predicted hydrocarbon binding protein
MTWQQIMQDAGLTEREAKSVLILSVSERLKASELAKELKTTRLDAYNSLSRLQETGIVSVSAEKPMRFSCPSVEQVVEKLIMMQKERLERTESGFKELQSNKKHMPKKRVEKSVAEEPKFAVLKERSSILNKIHEMVTLAEEKIVLILGQFGILHLCRSSAIAEINSAAERGLVVQVLAQLDRRTIRFFDELHPNVSIRHSDELGSQGVIVDELQVIQFLQVEKNPVGRGREDAALIIESKQFNSAQTNLVEVIWEEAIEFESAKKRFTEERIVDPLKLTVGEGSFLDIFREALGFSAELPEHDTPFDITSFMASGKELNAARKSLQSGQLDNLRILGIDIGNLLRQVGNRVGQELAFSLQSLDEDVNFLNEIMDWWEYAGLGELEYNFDPVFYVQANLPQSAGGANGDLPLWQMDYGIIEGALMSRYPEGSNVIIRKEGGESPTDPCKFYLIFTTNELTDFDITSDGEPVV